MECEVLRGLGGGGLEVPSDPQAALFSSGKDWVSFPSPIFFFCPFWVSP